MRTTVTTNTGVELFYKDWGSGQPIVFSHGWPTSSDDWDAQMLYFLRHGYRVIAFDRRGHGRSSLTPDGNDMDHFAADLATLTKALDLREAIHVGHSMGGGEVVRYAARCGHGRVAKIVLVGSVTPRLLQTHDAPDGIPFAIFEEFRRRVSTNRAGFYHELARGPFFGFNRPDVDPDPGIIENWWRQGMKGGVKSQFDCIRAFSETDFTSDLKAIQQPTLFLHGDDDQIVPYVLSQQAAQLMSHATVKIYPGYSHGMLTTHSEEINEDILRFIKA